jgi:hypothetical protein
MAVKTAIELGFVSVTPAALAALAEDGLVPQDVLSRHSNGDYGDATEERKQKNSLAVYLKAGLSVQSSYNLTNRKHQFLPSFWVFVITDAAKFPVGGVSRVTTQVLTCDEYFEEYRPPFI